MRAPKNPIFAPIDSIADDDENPYRMRECPAGCGRSHLLKEGEVCYWCGPPNPYGSGPLAVLIDAGGEDSPHPDRIADGTAGINLGLPPVETVVGTRPDGKAKLESRPITHHELANNRGVREYAKRNNLEPMTRGRYRGLR